MVCVQWSSLILLIISTIYMWVLVHKNSHLFIFCLFIYSKLWSRLASAAILTVQYVVLSAKGEGQSASRDDLHSPSEISVGGTSANGAFGGNFFFFLYIPSSKCRCRMMKVWV